MYYQAKKEKLNMELIGGAKKMKPMSHLSKHKLVRSISESLHYFYNRGINEAELDDLSTSIVNRVVRTLNEEAKRGKKNDTTKK